MALIEERDRRFAGSLLRLRHDVSARGQFLGCLLGNQDPLLTSSNAYIAPYLSDADSDLTIAAMVTAAAMVAAHPTAPRPAGASNFGASLRAFVVERPAQAQIVNARVSRLIDRRGVEFSPEIAEDLVNLCRLMDGSDAPVDWVQLAADLRDWTQQGSDSQVRKDWARAFWMEASSGTPVDGEHACSG